MEYDVIIGLEIHAELKTGSKMFCSCDNDSEDAEPNENTCPICLGHPGTLPYPNKQAIEWTILLGLGLNCKINKSSKFDRKNYFYPDLPKGYQISQYEIPFCEKGYLDTNGDKVAITRIHLEEDTGKSTHPSGKKYSLIDLNRAGTPLVEMVTEPVIKSAQQARLFCHRYQQILRYLDISNANMEKGEMRCEANISLQKKGEWKYEDGEIKPVGEAKLNPKTEIKNINSFKAVERAINYEIDRQAKLLDKGEEMPQETRGWDENKAKTLRQRVKESAADYRYFPEPDIPPINIEGEKISEIKVRLPEMPDAKKKRFMDNYDFSDENAKALVSSKDLAAYTEKVVSELRAWIDSTGDNWERQKKKLAKLTSNWLLSELFSHMNKDGLSINDINITPENFAELITLVYKEKINSSAGQKILKVMYEKGGDPTDIMKDMGLEQMDDEKQLEDTIKKVLQDNPDQVELYKGGKTALLQYFVGQTMAATKGKANPKKVSEILKKLLDN